MSFNVLGIRRFCSPNKGLRSKTRAAKMWVEVGVGASEATDLASRNPEPPNRRRSVYRLLCEVAPFFIHKIFHFFHVKIVIQQLIQPCLMQDSFLPVYHLKYAKIFLMSYNLLAHHLFEILFQNQHVFQH